MLQVFITSCMCVFALLVVLRSGYVRWLAYLVACPNEVLSGRFVNTCSVGYNNCKCCIDTHLTFPALTCSSEAWSEIFLQILKLGLYFEESVMGVWFFIKTMSPILKFVLSGSIIGGGHWSLAIFSFNTTII